MPTSNTRCHHPGCDRHIAANSKTGRCRNHAYKPGWCCKQCQGLIIRYRIKTRAEMQAEGLLP